MNKHKNMIILDRICKNNRKGFVTFNPSNTCKMGLAYRLWLPFLDQPQSDVVVCAIINSGIYQNLLIEWKHGISTNDILTFN